VWTDADIPIRKHTHSISPGEARSNTSSQGISTDRAVGIGQKGPTARAQA